MPFDSDVKLADKVRRVVYGRQSLHLGVELANISKVFGISGRTLKRRLSEEKTSHRAIVEDVRLMEASRLLIETRLPITEISIALGYSHPPSFTRAFKRAKGLSPSDFRDARRSPPDDPQR